MMVASVTPVIVVLVVLLVVVITYDNEIYDVLDDDNADDKVSNGRIYCLF